MPNIFKSIFGTISSIFQVGVAGPKLKKSSSSALDVRNSTDGAFSVVRVATPVGVNDATTKDYVDTATGNLGGALRVDRFVVDNTASQTSSFIIPANARVLEVRWEITTPYDNTPTIQFGQAGNLSLLGSYATNDEAQMISLDQDTAWGNSALALVVTISNAPTVGAGVVNVIFSIPN